MDHQQVKILKNYQKSGRANTIHTKLKASNDNIVQTCREVNGIEIDTDSDAR